MKCINHNEVEASAECSSCKKQLCRLCVQPDGSSVFCSDLCVNDFKTAQAKVELQQPSQRKIKIKLTIMLSLIVVILYMAYAYAALEIN
jgi:hypothetical protein